MVYKKYKPSSINLGWFTYFSLFFIIRPIFVLGFNHSGHSIDVAGIDVQGTRMQELLALM